MSDHLLLGYGKTSEIGAQSRTLTPPPPSALFAQHPFKREKEAHKQEEYRPPSRPSAVTDHRVILREYPFFGLLGTLYQNFLLAENLPDDSCIFDGRF